MRQTPSLRLQVVTERPFNAEVLLEQQRDVLTPNDRFYVRNHFDVPELAPDTWTLTVDGLVDRERRWTHGELLALPAHTLPATLECAGNGRSGLHPPVAGEPWGYGAVSTAEWTGASLCDVLDWSGVRDGTLEIVVEGADSGQVPDVGGVFNYARSMPLDQAIHPDVLLAYRMNGEPLPADHGYPVRLIVPGWYGMGSVKWVRRITAVAEPFRGFYQVDRYVIPLDGEPDREPLPLRDMEVRSVIARPTDGETLKPGSHKIEGFAWSGIAPPERIEVSVDGGATWRDAEWTSDIERYAWRSWSYEWVATSTGTVELLSRTTDARGRTQPLEQHRNTLGYCNNAAQRVTVTLAPQ